ncbi:hypothetical protein I6F37_41515 [Bradyrhizobium sp. NBAIM08]|nr:hypothetical protein [Bradyrhizobium sp. NBAIM08]
MPTVPTTPTGTDPARTTTDNVPATVLAQGGPAAAAPTGATSPTAMVGQALPDTGAPTGLLLWAALGLLLVAAGLVLALPGRRAILRR